MANDQKDSSLMYQLFSVNGIPVLTCKRDTTIRKPLAILCHGATEKKEQFLQTGLLHRFAQRGYYAVALDNRLSGERKPKKSLHQRVREFGKLDFYEKLVSADETAKDVSILIDAISCSEEVDASRILILGVSLGGIIAIKSMQRDERISAGITLISTFDLKIHPLAPELLQKFCVRDKINLAVTYGEAHNPIDALPALNQRPLLLVNGGKKDKLVDIERVRASQEILKKSYTDHPERLQIRVFNNLAHRFQKQEWDQVWREICIWLDSVPGLEQRDRTAV